MTTAILKWWQTVRCFLGEKIRFDDSDKIFIFNIVKYIFYNVE